MAIENRPAFFFAWFGVAKLGAVVAFIKANYEAVVARGGMLRVIITFMQ